MIHAEIDRTPDQRHRLFIGDLTEIIPEALRAEWNDRDAEFCFSPPATGAGGDWWIV